MEYQKSRKDAFLSGVVFTGEQRRKKKRQKKGGAQVDEGN